MTQYKRLGIVLSESQNKAVDKAIFESKLGNKQQFYRLALARLCEEYGIDFPQEIRKQAGTLEEYGNE